MRQDTSSPTSVNTIVIGGNVNGEGGGILINQLADLPEFEIAGL